MNKNNMPKLEFPEPKGLKENIEAFFTAVDIKEGFVVGLILFHVVSFLVIIKTRKRSNVQLGIFFSLLALCYFLENLNKELGENWKKITKQNYFDKSGFFICVMIGFPALCNCVIILIFSMTNSFRMMTDLVKAKAKQKTN
jgi:transmembrane protein 18